MNKSTESSLKGVLATVLPRYINHTQPCTVMVQEADTTTLLIGLASHAADQDAAA